MTPSYSTSNKISEIQNNYYKSLPDSLLKVLTDREVDSLAQVRFHEIANDWHAWKNAAESLHLNLSSVTFDESTPRENLIECQKVINEFYHSLNDKFTYCLTKVQNELHSDLEVPPFHHQGFLSHAKYHKDLLQFIEKNKQTIIIDSVLHESVDDQALLNLLLGEDVEPLAPENYPKTLGWVTLILSKSDFSVNLEFCRKILESHPLDPQDLTCLLYLACNDIGAESESKQIEVIEYLVSKGARWDINLLKDYTMFELMESPSPKSFIIEENLKNKLTLKQYIEAHLEGVGPTGQ